MNADQIANWIKEKPCECSKKNYFTTSLTLEEVPMLNGDVEVTFDIQITGKYWKCGNYNNLGQIQMRVMCARILSNL
jgi:hypothetical protein